MIEQPLISYLIVFSQHEIRIDFAREILANNNNFSPILMQRIMRINENQKSLYFTRHNLSTLLRAIGLELNHRDKESLFEYFDIRNQGEVTKESFIELLLPFNNQELRKTASKRFPKDLQFSLDLQYALKRFFMEILESRIEMRGYENYFADKDPKRSIQRVSEEEIRLFLVKFGKYPSKFELSFMVKMINSNRIKGITAKQIQQIIQRNQVAVKQNQTKNKQQFMHSDQFPSISHQYMSSIRKNSCQNCQSFAKTRSPIKELFSIEKNSFRNMQIFKTPNTKVPSKPPRKLKEESKRPLSEKKKSKAKFFIQPEKNQVYETISFRYQPIKNSSIMTHRQNKVSHSKQKRGHFGAITERKANFSEQLPKSNKKSKRKNLMKYTSQKLNHQKGKFNFVLSKPNKQIENQFQIIVNKNKSTNTNTKKKDNKGKFNFFNY